MNIGIIAVDNNLLITNFNQAARSLLAVGGSPAGQKLAEVLGPTHPLTALMQNGLAAESDLESQFIELYDGRLKIEINQIFDSQQRVAGAIAVLQDLSDERLREERLKRCEKLAILGEMAAGMAHELRNPLTAARGFIQLLDARYADEAKEKEYLKIIIEEIDRTNSIIKNFLMFAKPEPPSRAARNINSLLDEIIVLVESQGLLQEIQTIREYVSELPDVLVDGDQIKQVFLNLIQNAFQAMPKGGRLTIKTEYLADAGAVRVSFIDSGCGIPVENLARLFEPFFTTKSEGAGLGLAISSQIIKEHQGRIEVVSTIGSGTNFTVTLPVAN